MFLWIEFGCVGRQCFKVHVGWQLQILRPMRTCSVENHDDEVIRMTPPDFLQELRHVLGIHFISQHPIKLTVLRADRSIDICELSLITIGHDRTARSRCPTSPRFGHASKTSLVLEDQTHGAMVGIVSPDSGCQCFLEFFFQAA